MKYLLGKIDRKLKSASTVCPKLVLKPATWTSLVAQLIKIPPTMWETSVRSLGWEDPWRREKLTTPVFWPGEFHGVTKSWTRLSDFHFHRLLGISTWGPQIQTTLFWVKTGFPLKTVNVFPISFPGEESVFQQEVKCESCNLGWRKSFFILHRVDVNWVDTLQNVAVSGMLLVGVVQLLLVLWK